MNTLILGLTVIVAAPAPKELPKNPQDPFIGKWFAETEVVSGQLRKLMEPKPELVIAKDGVKYRANEKGPKRVVTFDYSKTPVEVSFGVEGSEERLLGICKIEGETLLLCYRYDGNRPTSFESQPKSHDRLITFLRVPTDK